MRDHRVLVGVIGAYVVGLVVLVTAPWGWALNRLTVELYVFFRHDVPIVPTWVGPEGWGVLLNVVLFVPLGVLVVMATGWRWWWVTIAAALTSTAIELGQREWLTRQASVQDVIANTLGAVLGAVGVSLLARHGWRRAGRRGSPRPR